MKPSEAERRKLEAERKRKKLENELWGAMDALLDQLRAVCVIPAKAGELAIKMTEEERLAILRLDRNYYNALRAGSADKEKWPPYSPVR